MTKNASNDDQRLIHVQAEFDSLADEYRHVHEKNIAVTGESPEYFSEYKIADLAQSVNDRACQKLRILDFGSGIGNSIPYFRKYFPDSELTCADVSARSIEIAQSRFPGAENYVKIDEVIPLPTNSYDIIFSACVFHHIPHDQHTYWLGELSRIAKSNGTLAIYEHNPLNPLTVRAVNTCPLDVNAKLIVAKQMKSTILQSGWRQAEVAYKVFFPSMLARMRGLERRLEWLAFGAQYRVLARRAL
ncbi:class I SAM-dependent methyltransferase [Paraburkholderia sp. SARCC-3016]|uniref:class I SAM-dependent methyltransferase n=1 Tax=Paraburkholderia sp. SARCC-3016 TaxID=3058611 RepID=UPI00280A0D51|nr:class I SAM-dependent methyltransferase [Paraburkholderia sp. SARCC-3016]MDQ7978070.1 class I SAM-dependent methyltransferase [Paraburkholderia sp. SARCC-3016]